MVAGAATAIAATDRRYHRILFSPRRSAAHHGGASASGSAPGFKEGPFGAQPASPQASNPGHTGLCLTGDREPTVYGLPVRSEIHASELINHRSFDAPRHVRLSILRNCLDELRKLDYISITNVIVNKVGKPADYDVFHSAWGTLFQRFENTMLWGNFPGAFRNDYGIVITDATAGLKLIRLMRRMAVFNYIPHDPRYGPGSRNIPIKRMIEDPHPKDSADALPIQMADVVAYFLYQRYAPNSFIRTKRV